MGKRITCTFLLGVTIFVFAIITSYVPTSLILSANTRPYNDTYVLNLGSEQTPTLSETYTNVEGDRGNRSFTYENVKHYGGGLCTIGANGTITKDLAANSLKSLIIESPETKGFEVTTSFDSSFSNPYIYNYSTNTLFERIVGNYIKIKAIEETNITSISLTYGCSTAESASSGVSIANENNYVWIENKENTDHTLLKIKLSSSENLTQNPNRVTLRNSDNFDNLSMEPDSVESVGNNNYIVSFNLSLLNANKTGLWTSYTYEPRIYVDNKRIDGSNSNGNLYIKENQSLDLTAIMYNHGGPIDDGKIDDNDYKDTTCGYKLNEENINGKKIITVSWTNTVDDENTKFNNKGLRFTKMGTNRNAIYSQNIEQAIQDNTEPYYVLSGWVSSLEEAEMYAKNYSRFALVAATGVSASVLRDFNKKAETGSYEEADGGYKITLKFPLGISPDTLTTGNEQSHIIVGLEYNGIPYIFRSGGNTSAVRIAQYFEGSETDKNFMPTLDNSNAGFGHNWVFYYLTPFYGWARLTFTHAASGKARPTPNS